MEIIMPRAKSKKTTAHTFTKTKPTPKPERFWEAYTGKLSGTKQMIAIAMFILAGAILLSFTAGCTKQQFQDTKQKIFRPLS